MTGEFGKLLKNYIVDYRVLERRDHRSESFGTLFFFIFIFNVEYV